MTTVPIQIIDKGASSEIIRQGYELNADGITKWLVGKKIIEQNDRLLNYIDLSPWRRAGGETYYTDFQITTNKKTSHIVVKSLVTMFPERSLQDWARRRNILAGIGIPVSNWYWYGEAAIIEDFYNFSAKEKVSFNTLLWIGFKLDSLGFPSLNFIDDIRADGGGKPYYIDFGFDLGEPSGVRTAYAKRCLHKMYPNNISDIDMFYTNNE
jgi:hypothetical protein